MQPWLLAALPALLLAAPATHAAPYQAVALDKSSIGFRYQQMGVAMDGRFRKFTPQLSFDPARPEQARASIEIELASVDAGSAEADGEVVGKPWFHTAAYPKASFVARQIKPVAPNQFEVTGALTLKGATREVKFPLKLTPQGKQGVFTGGFTIRRADFAVGEGMWSKFDIVANDIQVHFQLTALERQ